LPREMSALRPGTAGTLSIGEFDDFANVNHTETYLCAGRIDGVGAMLVPAVGVIVADGALAILLNVSVYWLHVEGSPEMAAWVGTFTRLFQSFYVTRAFDTVSSHDIYFYPLAAD